MAIDFASLVLAPAMATFAQPVTITPFVSQPNAAAYSARGIWTIQSTTIIGESGNQFSTVNIKLGIRLADYPAIIPVQGDKVTVASSDLPLGLDVQEANPNSNVYFIIDNVTPDGQGGAEMVLKRIVDTNSTAPFITAM